MYDSMMIDGVYAIQMPEDIYVSGATWHEYINTSTACNINAIEYFSELGQRDTMDVVSAVFCMMAYGNEETNNFRYFLEKPWKYNELLLVAMGSLGLLDHVADYDLEFEEVDGNTVCKVK